MIKVIYTEDGRFVPIVTCDICGQRIENVDLAAAVYPSRPRSKGDVLFGVLDVHKGSCLTRAARKFEAVGYRVAWVELTSHIGKVLESLGVNFTKLDELLRFYGFSAPDDIKPFDE